jgi:peptide/nickel transport system permease protein
MIGVLVIVYTITYHMPGRPAVSSRQAALLGMNKPYIEQLGSYIWNAVTKLDLGRSYLTNFPIAQDLASKIPVTFSISILGILLMLVVGLPLGTMSALKQYSALDIGLTSASLIMASIPAYVLALLSAVLFGVVLQWLPVTRLESWKSWILPVLCSSIGSIAHYTRMTRTTMLEVIRQDYIRTARAKGLKENVVIRRHALKNCLITLTTVVGGFVATVFSGSIIVETIFSIPGMGLYLMDGILARDYGVINGSVVVISLLVCIVNMVVDIVYAFIDPRIKAQFTASKKKRTA